MKLMAQSTKIREDKGKDANSESLSSGIPARKWRLRILDKDEGVKFKNGQGK